MGLDWVSNALAKATNADNSDWGDLFVHPCLRRRGKVNRGGRLGKGLDRAARRLLNNPVVPG